MKGPVEIMKDNIANGVDDKKQPDKITRFPGKTWPQVCAIFTGKN